eukprot:12062665-Alexandrium_andersonii.AAC.1
MKSIEEFMRITPSTPPATERAATVPEYAESCHNLTELKAWRDCELAHILSCVPKASQEAARMAVETEYEAYSVRVSSFESAEDRGLLRARRQDAWFAVPGHGAADGRGPGHVEADGRRGGRHEGLDHDEADGHGPQHREM